MSAIVSRSLSDCQSLGACDCGSVLLLSRLLIGSLACASVSGDDPELTLVNGAVNPDAGGAGHLESGERLTVNCDADGTRIR